MKTKKGRVWGIYTNIPWSDDKKYHRDNGSSFVFKIDEASNDVFTYSHKANGSDEVYHSDKWVFSMAKDPKAVRSDGKTSWANLGENFMAP